MTTRYPANFLIALCCMTLNWGWAQEQQDTNRSIEDVEVEIIRDRQISIPKAERNFQKSPPRSIVSDKPIFTYEFKNLQFAAPLYSPLIRPMRLREEPVFNAYEKYISAGFGNYISPYLEAWINSKQDKKRFYGAQIYHRSYFLGPVDGENSAAFTTRFNAFGNLYGKKISGGAYLNYENRIGYFYGYESAKDVKRDSIQQVYHRINFGGTVSNTEIRDFNFLLKTDFSYLTDHYKATEKMLSLQFKGDYMIKKNVLFLFPSDYTLLLRNDVSTNRDPRHLLTVKPMFKFTPLQNLSLTAGVNLIFENDTIQSSSFHIYPHLIAQYEIIKSLSAYASITGDFDKVSLHQLASENFWINPSGITIFHTNRSFEFSMGLKGKISKGVTFGVGFSTVELKSLYLYQNALQDRAKFDILYDDVGRINVYAEASYKKSTKIVLHARGDYFGYKTDKLAHPWHRPTYKISLHSTFDIYQKIALNVGFFGYGGMLGLDQERSQSIELDPVLDLNLKVDYFISKQVSVFLKLENILSKNYPVYLNYRVRGLQLMMGIAWSF